MPQVCTSYSVKSRYLMQLNILHETHLNVTEQVCSRRTESWDYVELNNLQSEEVKWSI